MAINYFGNTDLEKLILLIHTELAKYVKAVQGKQLSTEDFTTALKDKLDGMDLSLYSTTVDMNKAISDAIAGVTGISFDGPYASYADMVARVTTPKTGVIYLVNNGGTDPNVNDEYFWKASESKFEKFGSTAVDLSGYVKTTDLVEIPATDVEAEWNKIFN